MHVVRSASVPVLAAAVGAFLASLSLAALEAPSSAFLVVGLVFAFAATYRTIGFARRGAHSASGVREGESTKSASTGEPTANRSDPVGVDAGDAAVSPPMGQTWEGFVLYLEDDHFVGLLADVDGRFPENEVAFRLDEVSSAQRSDVREGTTFRWVVKAEDSAAGRTTVSRIEVLSVSEPSESDWLAGKELAREILGDLKSL